MTLNDLPLVGKLVVILPDGHKIKGPDIPPDVCMREVKNIMAKNDKIIVEVY